MSVTANTTLPASGWYDDEVTATATSSPVSRIDWRLDGGPWQVDTRPESELGPIVVPVGGEGIRILEVRDPDGRVSALAVPIDRSPPVVIAPAEQDFERGQTPADAFACADAGSGVASCTSTPIDTSTVTEPGSPRTYTVTAVDRVGRTTTRTVSYTVRAAADDVPPTITATVSPEPNAAGWHRANPTVSFECADEWSGIPDGACPGPETVTAAGVRVVTLTGIPTAPVCTTTDETSGVGTAATLSKTTTRVDGIPMTTATCSGATDIAGNSTPTLTRTYVAPLSFSGFESPVDNPPIVNVGKGGRSYPLKFALRDEQGELVSALAAVQRIRVVSVSCTSLDAAGPG